MKEKGGGVRLNRKEEKCDGMRSRSLCYQGDGHQEDAEAKNKKKKMANK